ncbi:type VI secretion system baseplate subunit TssK [Silvibacterium dinghuense]|uniref:Type VI secretion system baseplate subunit TssK n=1 Tax=Silvibacterium dinghuense TaxID=1560006 RepID=A0A4Q1SIK7_9BACT|nr:type VI secretion system baseplate subunit TssK [Silvibacterium dinghuense]RXS97436.1 hypothetical protein ESZ00_05940 [Silvibacterium dinghuense]GGG99005.1 hypothetical protein GCM10011586_13110 [Silvibacterium dinghuense]
MNQRRPDAGTELYLRSVNWEHGMLLTPDHLLRQERYLASLAMWGMTYLNRAAGLVGGGVRMPEADLGTVRFDPEVALHETAEYLDVAVQRARGLTPSGLIVDIEGGDAISVRVPKDQLAGVAEAVVYVVCDPAERVKVDGAVDSFNPQMHSERAPSYRVALSVNAAERAQALAVGRVKRPATGMSFEADVQYIPPCVAVSSHSELMTGTRRILEAVQRLAAGYAELHRAMREFMVLFTERGLETEVDRDSMQFAERMVLELQNASYALLERTQTPAQFFGRVRELLHSAAIYFDLAPGMQTYYDTLRDTGETEWLGLIEQQKHTLQLSRTLRLEEDLGLEVRKATAALVGLERLERALEGKYIDFRKSNTLESTNFIFDRGGKALYKLAARPARVQGIADEMTIFFSNLRLEGRDRYRLILIGDRNAPWVRGTSIGAEIRLNEGSGFRRESLILTGDVRQDDQYNIELDFQAPDVPTITDVRVTVPAYHTVHTALLFIRHRFYAGQREQPARILERDTPSEPSGFSSGSANGGRRSEVPPAAAEESRLPDLHTTSTVSPPGLQPTPHVQPPWMPRESSSTSTLGGEDPNKPRRRRLE